MPSPENARSERWTARADRGSSSMRPAFSGGTSEQLGSTGNLDACGKTALKPGCWPRRLAPEWPTRNLYACADNCSTRKCVQLVLFSQCPACDSFKPLAMFGLRSVKTSKGTVTYVQSYCRSCRARG